MYKVSRANEKTHTLESNIIKKYKHKGRWVYEAILGTHTGEYPHTFMKFGDVYEEYPLPNYVSPITLVKEEMS